MLTTSLQKLRHHSSTRLFSLSSRAFSSQGDSGASAFEGEMQSFAQKTLKTDFAYMNQSISGNVFQSAVPRPIGFPFTHCLFDFSVEALMQSNIRVIYYLLAGSSYGCYHYLAIEPHSMLFLGCTGLSMFMLVGLANYKMTMTLSVADAQVKSDGERVKLIMYDGRIHTVPIKQVKWLSNKADKCLFQTEDDEGKVRKYLMDFSRARPQQLVDKELCLAIMHPEVHQIAWKE